MRIKQWIYAAYDKALHLIMLFRFNGRVTVRGHCNLPVLWRLKVDKSSKADIGGLSIKRGGRIAVVAGGKLIVGDGVSVGEGCIIVARKRIRIGNDCMFAPYSLVYDHDHDYLSPNMKSNFKCEEICIGDKTWVGAGSFISKGSNIGNRSVIGAHSVVRGSHAPDSLLVGVAAREKRIDR